MQEQGLAGFISPEASLLTPSHCVLTLSLFYASVLLVFLLLKQTSSHIGLGLHSKSLLQSLL